MADDAVTASHNVGIDSRELFKARFGCDEGSAALETARLS